MLADALAFGPSSEFGCLGCRGLCCEMHLVLQMLQQALQLWLKAGKCGQQVVNILRTAQSGQIWFDKSSKCGVDFVSLGLR